ncbi:hypothetical protein, partial [Enterobacter hormaechei]|uniref:hypothetical protein n=1 Tax=Enterobacter hormaechei TaxID=158836 RepID=UPI001954E341
MAHPSVTALASETMAALTHAAVQASSTPLPVAAPPASSMVVWAAIIGATSALLVSILKDYLFERLK